MSPSGQRALGPAIVLSVIASIVVLTARPAQAGPRWLLVYYRQIGNFENANRQLLYNHCFDENGNKAAGVGLTNQFNPGVDLFGVTDAAGFKKITMDEANCTYDVQINQPGVPSDATPEFFWYNPPGPDTFYFSYVMHWMYVEDETVVTTFPTHPQYHYDRMEDHFNTVVNLDPSDCSADEFNYPWYAAGSDEKQLEGWMVGYFGQTFVVRPGCNRIVSAQVHVTEGAGTFIAFRASIHEGTPSGPQIGPTATSQLHDSDTFFDASVAWGLHDVPVVEGQTYALKVTVEGQGGLAAYATNTTGWQIGDEYPDGDLYKNTTAVPEQDLFALVVGVGVEEQPVFVLPDLDQDEYVNESDLQLFEPCASGPAVPLAPGCEDRDFDGDGDGDQSDFGILQLCFNPSAPADPTCDDAWAN